MRVTLNDGPRTSRCEQVPLVTTLFYRKQFYENKVRLQSQRCTQPVSTNHLVPFCQVTLSVHSEHLQSSSVHAPCASHATRKKVISCAI